MWALNMYAFQSRIISINVFLIISVLSYFVDIKYFPTCKCERKMGPNAEASLLGPFRMWSHLA